MPSRIGLGINKLGGGLSKLEGSPTSIGTTNGTYTVKDIKDQIVTKNIKIIVESSTPSNVPWAVRLSNIDKTFTAIISGRYYIQIYRNFPTTDTVIDATTGYIDMIINSWISFRLGKIDEETPGVFITYGGGAFTGNNTTGYTLIDSGYMSVTIFWHSDQP